MTRWQKQIYLVAGGGGGGGKKIYGPEGSQALPALPFDKNTVNMEASVEQ